MKNKIKKDTSTLSLTKQVYGCEWDASKTPFGFLNGQVRINSIINNAGWYNLSGEKLGYGDLSIDDLSTIASQIDDSGSFFVMPEFRSSWNFPKELDQSVPGRDYVRKYSALWIAAGCIVKASVLPVIDELDNYFKDKKSSIVYCQHKHQGDFIRHIETFEKLTSAPREELFKEQISNFDSLLNSLSPGLIGKAKPTLITNPILTIAPATNGNSPAPPTNPNNAINLPPGQAPKIGPAGVLPPTQFPVGALSPTAPSIGPTTTTTKPKPIKKVSAQPKI